MGHPRAEGREEAGAEAALIRALSIVLLALAPLSACAAKKKPQSVVLVPKQCIRAKITGFGEPCVEQRDGSLLCNKVHVQAVCIAAK